MTAKPTVTRMEPTKVKLYIDTVSPFAYEAYYILRVRCGVTTGILDEDEDAVLNCALLC